METFIFDVQEMHCGGCAVRVRHEIRKLDGVMRAEVTLNPPCAAVEFDPSLITAAQIEAALARMNYPARARGHGRKPISNDLSASSVRTP